MFSGKFWTTKGIIQYDERKKLLKLLLQMQTQLLSIFLIHFQNIMFFFKINKEASSHLFPIVYCARVYGWMDHVICM